MVKITKRGWLTLSLLFSFAVIAVIIVTTFNAETIASLLAINVFFLVLAVICRLIALVLWGVRISVMSRSLGHRVGLLYCINMVLASLLAGTITPGQAGGEPVRVHQLFRAGVSVGDASAVVIMERVLDGIVLTIMGLVIIVATGSLWRTFGPALLVLIIIAWVFMISFLAIPIIALKYPDKAKKGLMRLIPWIINKCRFAGLSTEKTISSIDKEIDNFFSGLSHFRGPARWGLYAGGLATGAFWITEFLVASIILMGLGLDPFFLTSFFFQIVIAIVMMIPLTPGSSGVTEISTSSLYALIIPSGLIGIFVLLWRSITFYLNILLGAVAGVVIYRREMSVNHGEEALGDGQD